jgi:glycosyltransferase involved in cell wall biosynthesis
MPLLLVGSLRPGGSERQGYLLVRALRDLGLRPGVIVWTLTGEDFYRDLIQQCGIPLVHPPQDKGPLSKLAWLRGTVREVRPAVLHSMAFYLNSPAWWAMRGNGVAIGSIRGEYSFERRVGPVHYALNRHWPNSIIANSQRSWQEAKLDTGFFRVRNPMWVPNGLDADQYSPRNHGDNGFVRVIAVGNLHPYKRWDRLVHTVAELARAMPAARFEVLIVGEGGERARLAALIAETGMDRIVRLMGRRFDVPELLSESDIFVLTSDTEGTPNAIMEAMAAGLPVVTSDVGDAPRLVADGETGFVAARDDVQGFVTSLGKLIADAGLRARMGAAGRKRAETEFSLESLAQRTIDAYRCAGWTGN